MVVFGYFVGGVGGGGVGVFCLGMLYLYVLDLWCVGLCWCGDVVGGCFWVDYLVVVEW